MNNIIVIIPTYNEISNISRLIELIKNIGYDNIWIKQIPKVGYWKYIIDDIEYYI